MNNTPCKKTLPLVAAALLAVAGCSGNATENKASQTITKDSSELQKVGYSFGYSFGTNGRDMIDDLDLDAFEAGLRDAYAKKDPKLTDEDMQAVLIAYDEKKKAKYMEELQSKAAANKKTGEDFLVANAKKEGVQVTPSGLQYKVLSAGSGAEPKASDMVEVHYEGRLIDGTVFDSSKKRGEPARFGVSDVIAGWTEGLQLMKPGAKYQFFIPANLAYGETGKGDIEPNSALIFDVELLKVNP